MPKKCPCMIGVGGAFGVTFALYWAWLFGLRFLIGQLQDGNLIAIAWAAILFFSAGTLLRGINEARSHEDERSGGEVVGALLLGAFCGWALWHHWFLDSAGWAFHLSRAFWLSCMGAMAFQIWLNFRGPRRQRPAVPQPVELPQRPQRFGLRRSRTIKVVEVIEGHGVENLTHHLGSNTPYYAPPHASPLIGPDGRPVPQIVYVKDEETGEFIPVELPEDRVPVLRGRR
jgi:hypothetical protein